LNGILGFSKLLHDEINSLQVIREYTGIIQESGERLLSIINNVLDISKIETGQVFITKKSFSINSMLCSLFSFFKPIVHSKGIEINYIIPTTIKETWVYTDDVKLNQILTNLINNAIKFTLKGKIDFGYEIKGNFVEFFVKDTGIGISPEHQERIFDRFTQVDLTATKDFEGAGLGLAICKGLVELLGGNIWLESKIGIGSTFYFTIPYQNTLEAEEKEPTESRGFVKKRKIILVAEDDITSYLYLEKIFKNKEFQLIHASNGKEAVRHVKNNPEIDFVLMDIAMPIMDGLEATKIIKTIRPELPIIAQTAYAFSQEREKILTVGCDDYLSKPIDSAKLLRLLVK